MDDKDKRYESRNIFSRNGCHSSIKHISSHLPLIMKLRSAFLLNRPLNVPPAALRTPTSGALNAANWKSLIAPPCFLLPWKEHWGRAGDGGGRAGDGDGLLWGSFFSRIPSTTPSDLILRKKPPFLQYSLLGSLKLPGGKPLLPPSSGVDGSVVIPPVAISSSSFLCLPVNAWSPRAEQEPPVRPLTSHWLFTSSPPPPDSLLILLHLGGHFPSTPLCRWATKALPLLLRPKNLLLKAVLTARCFL